jgi:hypothetical protein
MLSIIRDGPLWDRCPLGENLCCLCGVLLWSVACRYELIEPAFTFLDILMVVWLRVFLLLWICVHREIVIERGFSKYDRRDYDRVRQPVDEQR